MSLAVVLVSSALACIFIFYLGTINPKKTNTTSDQEVAPNSTSIFPSDKKRQIDMVVEKAPTSTVPVHSDSLTRQTPRVTIKNSDALVTQTRDNAQVQVTPSPTSNTETGGTRMIPSFFTAEGWTDVNPRLSTGPGFPEESRYLSVFEKSTVVGFYGAHGICQMGILGCLSLDEISDVLDGYLRQYDELNGPDKSVIGALHYIADIAQSEPGELGDYVRHVELENVLEYANFCEREGLLLFIDLQVGWGDVSEHINRFLPLLRRPNVHLALDPEWATKYSGIPPGGDYIGRLTVAEIDAVQGILSDLVITHDLPRKALVVHQFLSIMLPDEAFADIPEVDLIIDADGWGTPAAKLADFSQFSLGPSSEWPAIKLFFDWDDPLLEPTELMRLSFPPAYVIYQ